MLSIALICIGMVAFYPLSGIEKYAIKKGQDVTKAVNSFKKSRTIARVLFVVTLIMLIHELSK